MRQFLKILLLIIPAGLYLTLVFLLPGSGYTDPILRRWLFIGCSFLAALLLPALLAALG